ncbi:MAG: heparinase II/III family protein [Candidatus Krumholzibacteria bacterium]|nr:heparinase II/III family protein [Candidatus Krumholzibacteria bacterium]
MFEGRKKTPALACLVVMASLLPSSALCARCKGYHAVLTPRFAPENVFDLSAGGMEAAAGRLREDDRAACRAAIFERLMDQRRPSAVESWPPRPDALGRADSLLGDVYILGVHEGRRLGRDIGWDENPAESANWEFNLLAMDFLPNLSEAFRVTADKKYIDRGREAILDFVRDNADPEALPSRYSWYDHSVAYRSIYAVDFWKLWASLGERDDSFASAFIEFIWRHAIYLAEERYYSRMTNHGIFANIALLRIAAAFPEFLESKAWRALAVERMEKQASDNYTEDGIHREFAPSYHLLATKLMLRFRDDCLRSGGAPLSPGFEAVMAKAVDNIVHLAHPDGELVLFGDSSTGEFRNALQSFGPEDPVFLYVSSRGGPGVPPAETSRALHETGFFMMRSGWGTGRPFSDETFLIADFSPWGKAHQHEDFLSFELSARGFRWFTDLGTFSYDNDDPGRKYVTSPPAHNIVVPFSEQAAARPRGRERIEDRTKRPFESIVEHTETLTDPAGRIASCRQLLARDIGDLEDRVLLIMAMSLEELGSNDQEARECLERILAMEGGSPYSEIASQLLGTLDLDVEKMVFDDSSDMEVHGRPGTPPARTLLPQDEPLKIEGGGIGDPGTSVPDPGVRNDASPTSQTVRPDIKQSPEVRHWISNGDFDYLEGGFNYCRNFRHERAILFIKPFHFIIVDRIHDGIKFEYGELFHLKPGVKTAGAGNNYLLTAQDSLGCVFMCLSSPPQASSSVIEGRARAGLQGWYSGSFGNLEPAPVIRYSFTPPEPGDYYFVHAVLPLGTDAAAEYRLVVDEKISGAPWNPLGGAPLVFTIEEPGYRTAVSFMPSAAFRAQSPQGGRGPEISVARKRI